MASLLLSPYCVQTLDISDKPIYQIANTFKWVFLGLAPMFLLASNYEKIICLQIK